MTTPAPDTQVPGVYHRRVGDIVVSVLHDGHQDVPMTSVMNIPPEEAAAMMHEAYRPTPRRTAVNTFLIRSAGRIALVDTGCGPNARPTVGYLAANLKACGLTPADIDTILLTHMHPDHWGGLLDKEGGPAFPNAELKVGETEYRYWHDDAALRRLATPAQQKLFVLDARAHLAPYRERLTLFAGGDIFPGVTTLPLPGHTPGHTGMLVASGSQALLIWGDITHVPELQVSRPEVTMAVDVEPEMAIATRRHVFDMVTTERMAFAGMHLHFPALAHMTRRSEGHVLLPDAWCLEI